MVFIFLLKELERWKHLNCICITDLERYLFMNNWKF
nr:MAG TPA: hypothetical protein [Caudoviricetes sp.]